MVTLPVDVGGALASVPLPKAIFELEPAAWNSYDFEMAVATGLADLTEETLQFVGETMTTGVLNSKAQANLAVANVGVDLSTLDLADKAKAVNAQSQAKRQGLETLTALSQAFDTSAVKLSSKVESTVSRLRAVLAPAKGNESALEARAVRQYGREALATLFETNDIDLHTLTTMDARWDLGAIIARWAASEGVAEAITTMPSLMHTVLLASEIPVAINRDGSGAEAANTLLADLEKYGLQSTKVAVTVAASQDSKAAELDF
jgi:hypothetical protein